MSDDITTTIANYIRREILKQPNRVIQPEEKLLSSGLIDSFHLVDMAVYIEDTFGVHIDDTELSADTFDTLSELAALVLQRQG